MKTSLNTLCCNYYLASERLLKEQQRFDELLAKPTSFAGQTYLPDIDKTLRRWHKRQEASDAITYTQAELTDLQAMILILFELIGAQPHTRFTGQIPDEAEFAIWADDANQLHYEKLKDLTPVREGHWITLHFKDKYGRDAEHNDDDDDD